VVLVIYFSVLFFSAPWSFGLNLFIRFWHGKLTNSMSRYSWSSFRPLFIKS